MYKRATSEGCVAYLRLVQLPSRLIEAAVDQMATLPGVGRRTALRLVLNMLARDEERVRDFADAMVAMREGVKPCTVCHNPTEEEVCNLCANPHRDAATVCVVEDVRDLLALDQVRSTHSWISCPLAMSHICLTNTLPQLPGTRSFDCCSRAAAPAPRCAGRASPRRSI